MNSLLVTVVVVVVVVEVVVGSVVVVVSDTEVKEEIADRKLIKADLIVPKITLALAFFQNGFLLLVLSSFQI